MVKHQIKNDKNMLPDGKNLIDSKEDLNKLSILSRITKVLLSSKKENAKNAIMSHPRMLELFRYEYADDCTGDLAHEAIWKEEIPEEVKREIINWIRENIDNMLNSIISNPLKYCYREQYHDRHFSYSKFEELFKKNFWEFYNRHKYGDLLCKVMFQEITQSFNWERLWDYKRVRDIQDFIINDGTTQSLSKFYTEEQLWKKTYSMLVVIDDTYRDENGSILYNKFKTLFEKTFEKLYRIDPTWWEEVCNAVIRGIWRICDREIDFNN